MLSYRLIIATAVVFAVVFVIGGAYWHGRLAANDEWELKWAKASQEAENRARVREEEMQAQVDAVRKSLSESKNEISKKNIVIQSLRVSTAGLREQLADYTANTQSEASCREKLRALGEVTARGAELLSEGQSLVQRFAATHDQRAAETQALIEGWPK